MAESLVPPDLVGSWGEAIPEDLFLYLSRFTTEEQSRLWLELGKNTKMSKLTISLRGYSPMSTISRHPLWGKRHLLDDLVNFFKGLFGYSLHLSEFATALRVNSHLTTLDLSLNQIGPSGATELASVLAENRTLRHLNLSDNNLGNRGAEALAAGLQYNTTLQSLNLSSNAIDQIHFITLALEKARLAELSLACNRIDCEGAEALAVLLGRNHHLRSLCLECTQLGDQGVEILSLGLQRSHGLAKLDFSHNEIRDLGAKYLCLALAGNQTLCALNLFGNHLGDLGANRVLALVSHECLGLAQINLGANAAVRPQMRRRIKLALDKRRTIHAVLAVRSARMIPRLGQDCALARLPKELVVLLRGTL
ncbi:hypothetical protein BASA81_006710 [Batrachochytrium salamandrivorans]|nr:hypothetical protein BASA81_006710 [Batrachochytrium salamandrivorans]